MSTQADGVNILLGWLLESRKKQWLTVSKIEKPDYHVVMEEKILYYFIIYSILYYGRRNQRLREVGMRWGMEAGKPASRLCGAGAQETDRSPEG